MNSFTVQDVGQEVMLPANSQRKGLMSSRDSPLTRTIRQSIPTKIPSYYNILQPSSIIIRLKEQ